MNTIVSLIPTDPNLAEATLEDLSELFRASLKSPGLVKLADEIQLCQRYLAIEQRRLQQRLTVDWDYPTPMPEVEIPSLLIQPLVENAIYHGIQRLPKGGDLKLSIKIKQDHIQILIDNPIPTLTISQTDKGNQMALENIRHRMQLYYGNSSDLTVKTTAERYQVMLTIPLKSQD